MRPDRCQCRLVELLDLCDADPHQRNGPSEPDRRFFLREVLLAANDSGPSCGANPDASVDRIALPAIDYGAPN